MRYLLICFISCFCYAATAQVRIVGADCVFPGSPYQYIINARFDSTLTNLSICITGGKLQNNNTCIPGGSRPNTIVVIWDTSATKKIELQSSQGNASFPVRLTSQLHGGNIVSGDLLQISDSTIHAYNFRCSDPVGGSCSPAYIYQWQESTDGVVWRNIINAKSKDLTYTEALQTSLFFRRMVTDADSNTSAYSDLCQLIYVKH